MQVFFLCAFSTAWLFVMILNRSDRLILDGLYSDWSLYKVFFSCQFVTRQILFSDGVLSKRFSASCLLTRRPIFYLYFFIFFLCEFFWVT